jgi:hypothetical protein
MWHELDGEDVCGVARGDLGGEGERFDGVVGLVAVDEEIGVVRARGQQAARLGPAVKG